jgi:Ca2+-binding EF-hand superfamily protein
MKRTISLFLLAGFLFANGVPSFAGNGITEDKYEDAKPILTDLAVLIETFVENMNQVDQPKDVAKILDTFAEDMKGLVPKINEVREKYPELDDEDTHPEELKSLLQRVDKDFQEMMKSYAKVNANLSDPAVKEADTKFKDVMSALG